MAFNVISKSNLDDGRLERIYISGVRSDWIISKVPFNFEHLSVLL